LRALFVDLPLLLPGVVLSIGLAVLLAPWLSQRLRTSRSVGFLVLASIGVIVAATITPDLAALAGGPPSDGVCDLRRIGLPPLAALRGINQTSLNVLLFVPLGFAIGLLPPSRRVALVLLLVLASPFVVELTQLTVTSLGRGCQSADVIDNSLGLIVGLALASIIRMNRGTTPIT
jgi:hypothetical protein